MNGHICNLYTCALYDPVLIESIQKKLKRILVETMETNGKAPLYRVKQRDIWRLNDTNEARETTSLYIIRY